MPRVSCLIARVSSLVSRASCFFMAPIFMSRTWWLMAHVFMPHVSCHHPPPPMEEGGVMSHISEDRRQETWVMRHEAWYKRQKTRGLVSRVSCLMFFHASCLKSSCLMSHACLMPPISNVRHGTWGMRLETWNVKHRTWDKSHDKTWDMIRWK